MDAIGAIGLIPLPKRGSWWPCITIASLSCFRFSAGVDFAQKTVDEVGLRHRHSPRGRTRSAPPIEIVPRGRTWPAKWGRMDRCGSARRLTRSLGPSKTEDQGKGIVHGAKLIGVEASSRASKALSIYHRALLDEDLRLVPLQSDHGPEGGRMGTRRGGREQGRAQPKELERLKNHRVTGTALLAATRTSRGRQSKDLAANHVSRALRVPVPT